MKKKIAGGRKAGRASKKQGLDPQLLEGRPERGTVEGGGVTLKAAIYDGRTLLSAKKLHICKENQENVLSPSQPFPLLENWATEYL